MTDEQVAAMAEQNSFNLGAASRANNGGKNPYSVKTQPALHKAWQEGWSEEEAFWLNLQAPAR